MLSPYRPPLLAFISLVQNLKYEGSIRSRAQVRSYFFRMNRINLFRVFLWSYYCQLYLFSTLNKAITRLANVV